MCIRDRINFSVLATFAVIAGSIWFNRRLRQRARIVQEETGDRPTTWWKSLLILFVPVLVLLYAMGLHFEVPAFAVGENGVSKGFNFVGGINIAHSFTALLIALSLYTGSYIAEAVRGGILAISRGQTEAAFAPVSYTHLDVYKRQVRVTIFHQSPTDATHSFA